MAVIGSDVQNLVIENIFLTEGVHRFSTMIHSTDLLEFYSVPNMIGLLYSKKTNTKAIRKVPINRSC